MLNKNDEIEVTITDIGTEGEGIGRFDGMALFVKGAVIGDRVLAGITKVKKTYAYARVIRVIDPSPARVEPPCKVAGPCGGCQLQAMSYEKQLEYKQDKVKADLIRLGGIPEAKLDMQGIPGAKPESGKISEAKPEQGKISGAKPESGKIFGTKSEPGEQGSRDTVCFHRILGMEHPEHYRNKAQYPVAADREGNPIAGFYAGHSHAVIRTESCLIQHPLADRLTAAVLAYMKEAAVSAYNEESGRGLVRHILTRVGFTSHEVMVCLVINGSRLPKTEILESKLLKAIEEFNADPGTFTPNDLAEGGSRLPYVLQSLTYNVNTENTNVIMGEKLGVISGKDYITDYIGQVRFRISPLSFYQVNPVQTRKLYETALKYAGLTGRETVWDLYCGIGTISLSMASQAGRVFGVEIVPQAIEDAKFNAKLNGIGNAEFFTGAAEEVLPARYREDPSIRADVIVVDPPRKGCDPALLDCITGLEPERIVYVSCDPATLARDIRYLGERGYELKEVQPVDMFPGTIHVETCVLLTKASVSED